MENQELSPRPHFKALALFGAAFALLAIAAAIAYFFVSRAPREVREERLHTYGETLQELASSASPAEEARLKRTFALSLLIEDRKKEAFELLQEVASNETYTPHDRALAVELMGDLFLDVSNATPDIAREYVFAAEPLASFAVKETFDATGLRNALRKLYVHAMSLFPTPVAELRLAQLSAQDAFVLSGTEQEDALKEAMARWKSGTALLDSLSLSRASYDPQADMMRGHALRLKGMVALAFFELGEEEYQEIAQMSLHDAREAMIQTIKNEGEDPVNYYVNELLWTDLYYLDALLALEEEKGKETIETLNLVREMADLYPRASVGFRYQLQNLVVPFAPSRAEAREKTLYISQFDPQAAEFLSKLFAY